MSQRALSRCPQVSAVWKPEIGLFLFHHPIVQKYFFLLLLYKESISYKQLVFGLKVAIALTFTCHGLYAVGYYPRPGKFIQMTMTILGTNKEASVIFLNIGVCEFWCNCLKRGILLFQIIIKVLRFRVLYVKCFV